MANITGQGRPTIYTKANKGDIYTDTNTGIKYECLGPDGFVEAGDIEKNKYDWKEIKTSGGGTGGVSSWNDLTDKPFGEAVVKNVLVEKQKITIEPFYEKSSDPVFGRYYVENDESINTLTLGDKVIVEFEGAMYDFIVEKDPYTSNDMYFGNISIMKSSVEATYPNAPLVFYMSFNPGGYSVNVYTNVDLIGEREYAIYTESVGVKTIDEKYIPETIARVTVINGIDTTTITEADGKTGFQLEDMGDFVYFEEEAGITRHKTDLKLGDVVTVIFDEVEYKVPVVHSENNLLCFGNKKLASNTFPDENSNYGINVPFVVWGGIHQGGYYVSTEDGGEHTISFYRDTADGKRLGEYILPESVEGLVVRSSTEGSTKKFKIAVDDTGAITATEV